MNSLARTADMWYIYSLGNDSAFAHGAAMPATTTKKKPFGQRYFRQHTPPGDWQKACRPGWLVMESEKHDPNRTQKWDSVGFASEWGWVSWNPWYGCWTGKVRGITGVNQKYPRGSARPREVMMAVEAAYRAMERKMKWLSVRK